MEKRKVKYLKLKAAAAAAAVQNENQESRGRGGSFRCNSDDLYTLLYCDATNEKHVARKCRMVVFVPNRLEVKKEKSGG